MSDARVDRNLLFGVLALQMDFIDRDSLIAAMNAWALEKSKSLGQILLERKSLTDEEHHVLIAVVAKHIERHGGDARQSLLAIGPLGVGEGDLDRVADTDIHATLYAVTRARSNVDQSTLPPRGRQAANGDRFEILRSHAWGGLGEVFVARDHELNREVALKKMHERHANDEGSRTRFLAEAEITGGLEHPGIVPVYGLGLQDDGQPYYAMRFIRGETLKDAIERYHADDKRPSSERHVELRQLLSRFITVCNAIDYAHSRGVIHRDIKPSNIMLGKYGETLVVDWGLAKAQGHRVGDTPTSELTLMPISGGSSETLPGSTIGTPAFMSPEQAEGKIDSIGPTSDVYSLGATLYMLLTGSEPFEGPVLGVVLANVQNGKFLPPRRRNPRVSPVLEAICLKAMKLSRWERYPTCAALANDVEHWLADEPVTAYSDPLPARAARWIKRNRGWAAASAALAVAAFIGLIAGTAFLTHSNALITQEAKEASDQRTLAEDRELRARNYLYTAQMNLAQQAWNAGQLQRVMDLLDQQRPQPGQQDLRGFGWYYMSRLCHGELRIMPSFGSAVWSVANSPDGKTLAISRSVIHLWDLESNSLRLSMGGNDGDVNCVAFSPDGTLLAAANANSTVKLWSVADGTELATLTGHHDQVASVAFSPDGNTLVSGGFDGTVRRWSVPAFSSAAAKTPANPLANLVTKFLRSAEQFPGPPGQNGGIVLSGHHGEVYGVAFSPDGKLIASAGKDKIVRLWDAATREQRAILLGHSDSVSPVAFSPDGKLLASGSDDRTVKLWDVATMKEVASLTGHIDWIQSLAFSDDGTFLASGARDNMVEVWRLASVAESAGPAVAEEQRPVAAPLPNRAGGVADAAASPQAAPARAQYFPWTVFKGHINQVGALAFMRNSTTLVSGALDGSVKLWNVVDGQDCVTLYGHNRRNYCVAFSPDGKLAASGSDDLTVRLWDVATGRNVAILTGHAQRVRSVCFSPDSKTLASTGWEGTVRLWDVATGRQRGELSPLGQTTGIAYSPDGKTLASCSSISLILWDVTTGKPRATLPAQNGNLLCVAYSPDGKLVAASGGSKTIQLWDAATGVPMGILEGHTAQVLSIAFSPDSQTLASGSADTTVRLWDVANHSPVLTLSGHNKAVNSVAISPDGKVIASASSDGSAILWDIAKKGRDLITLSGHSTVVQSLAFSPNGKMLATTGFDQTVKLWNISAAGGP